MTGVWVLLGALAVASALGTLWRARQGRIRALTGAPSLPDEVRALLAPHAAVTLVQVSTTFCVPCRQARALLADLAERTTGLHHAELDVTERPELAKAVAVLSTPTTLAVDARGTELVRVSGVPNRATLLAALRPHLPPPDCAA